MGSNSLGLVGSCSFSAVMAFICMVCFLLLNAQFPFSKVKITSEPGSADCGLSTLTVSLGLGDLSPSNKEIDLRLLLRKNGKHLDMVIC